MARTWNPFENEPMTLESLNANMVEVLHQRDLLNQREAELRQEALNCCPVRVGQHLRSPQGVLYGVRSIQAFWQSATFKFWIKVARITATGSLAQLGHVMVNSDDLKEWITRP